MSYHPVHPEYRFVVPSEGVLFRGDVGISQMCYGISSPSQLACLNAMVSDVKGEPEDGVESVLVDTVTARAKKMYPRYSKNDMDFKTWVYAYLAYLFSRDTKLVPTSLGNYVGRETLEPYESLSEIYRDFRRVDRMRTIAMLSTEGEVSKSELREEVMAPGSLDYNLKVLADKKVITTGDKIASSKNFEKYLFELERLERLVSEAADKEMRKGITLEARHVMNEKYVKASPFDTLAQVLFRMIVLEAIHGIVVPTSDGYVILERDKALKASVTGIPGSTRILSEQMKDYIKVPCRVELDTPVFEVARRMDESGLELAAVFGSDILQGIISTRDLLVLNSYHDLPFRPRS